MPALNVRWLAVGGLALIVVVAGGFGARHFLARGPGATPVRSEPLPKTESSGHSEPKPVPKPEPKPGPAGQAQSVADAMARARAALESGDYGAAVLARVQRGDRDRSDNVRSQEAAQRAGGSTRTKAEGEKPDQARKVFANGEYESALRLLYRLPDGLVPPATLNRYKKNGWYNLGVIALRGADCKQARERFAEALDLGGEDPVVRRGKRLADACAGQQKDRTYYDIVEGLPFRNLEE